MKAVHDVLTKIEETLQENPFVNTVKHGDIFEVDLDKSTNFPYAHFILNSVVVRGSVLTMSVSILAMGAHDEDNEDYALAEQLGVIVKVIEVMRRGDLRCEKFHLRNQPLCEPFKDRFEGAIIGFEATLEIDVPNEMGWQ